MPVRAVDINGGENSTTQTTLELESDLHFTDKLRVFEGRWEKIEGGFLKPRYRKEVQCDERNQ